jgi:hypothetical protein
MTTQNLHDLFRVTKHHDNQALPHTTLSWECQKEIFYNGEHKGQFTAIVSREDLKYTENYILVGVSPSRKTNGWRMFAHAG